MTSLYTVSPSLSTISHWQGARSASHLLYPAEKVLRLNTALIIKKLLFFFSYVVLLNNGYF
jgi:hypothetical protein